MVAFLGFYGQYLANGLVCCPRRLRLLYVVWSCMNHSCLSALHDLPRMRSRMPVIPMPVLPCAFPFFNFVYETYRLGTRNLLWRLGQGSLCLY